VWERGGYFFAKEYTEENRFLFDDTHHYKVNIYPPCAAGRAVPAA
jgi:hypothetical protein